MPGIIVRVELQEGCEAAKDSLFVSQQQRFSFHFRVSINRVVGKKKKKFKNQVETNAMGKKFSHQQKMHDNYSIIVYSNFSSSCYFFEQ